MIKRLWVFALACILFISSSAPAFAATLGPVTSFAELRDLLAAADDGDTILISGDISAQGNQPLSTAAAVHLRSEDGAALRGLHLRDASISFTNITLDDTLTVDGTSHIQLGKNVTVTGAANRAGLDFSGDGTLIIESGCHVQGGSSSAGIIISHKGGEFYSSIEGTVSGGSGTNGGPGMMISPLGNAGAVMITGSIQGGSGSSLGGHALNLYGLNGNAYVTVDGSLQGGGGTIGGDGIQLVAASDNVNVGISGKIKGGQGESYGGNALILMNAEDSSSFNLSGHFSGGDATGENAQPGTSLQLVGDSAALRARIDNCILEDGRQLAPMPTAEPTVSATAEPAVDLTAESTQEPDTEPTPEPTPTAVPEPTPEVTPLPEITAPANNPATMITPKPTVTPEPTADSESEITAKPSETYDEPSHDKDFSDVIA